MQLGNHIDSQKMASTPKLENGEQRTRITDWDGPDDPVRVPNFHYVFSC